MTGDDEADSLLRAVAAAPAATPTRMVTVLVIGAGDAAPADDQWSLVRVRVADRASEVTERGQWLAVVWRRNDHARRAVTSALELRETFGGSRIALVTADLESGVDIDAVIERAIELVDATGGTIRIDAATAARVASEFSVRVPTDGEHAVLVEPIATGSPARINHTIGNYRIVRLLGTGGMGVVYLAEHIWLGRKVVVKYVQERLSSTDEFAARFFTEAKTAASIRHPGIVDVFDYGRDDHGRNYIVMELLDGESLRARLRREHPLPIDLATAIASQIASALAAAHDAGVIHRDLKPDNLFLVPDAEAPHRTRVKVLDFGLAKRDAPDERGVTRTGDFVGTPLYMSPEQCRGKGVDQRTDVYSLGCILFELVCGRTPFVDETVGDLIIAHNSTPPPAPRSLQPHVSVGLERVILHALAKSPAERYPTMSAFGAELAALATATPGALAETAIARRASATPVAKRARRRRLQLAVAVASAAAIAGAIAIVASSRISAPSESRVASAGTTARRSVAVIGLRGTAGTGDDAWLASALSELVTSELTVADQLSIAPASDVARMKVELALGDVDHLTADQLDRIRSDLGADYAAAGSYTTANGQLHVAVALYDTRTNAKLGDATADGSPADLGSVSARLAAELERLLDVAAPVVAPAQAASILPSNPAAARYYAEGLAKLRGFDLVAARALFTRAASEEPTDPLIHSALATAWQQLGYSTNAATEAKLAYDHSSALPREQRLAIEARYRETTTQWGQAIDAYRTLFEFFPTRLDYGLELAEAQTHSGDAKSAYATLDALRKQPQLASDPRIELAEAAAAEAADDTERERDHANRAASLARKRGARIVLAEARLREGWALWSLGRDEDAQAAYAESQQLFTALNDRSGLARCLNNIGLAAHRAHHDAEASAAFDHALELATATGDTIVQAWVLNNWAYALTDQGELDRALQIYRRKLELGGARGDTASSQAAAHANIAEILRWQGDLAGARRDAETAEGLLRGIDARRFAAFTAYQLAEIDRAEDAVDSSRRRLKQALTWASDVMAPAETAEIRISLARTELDAGQTSDAEALARAALDDLRAANDASQSVCATAVLANVLLASDRVADAERELAAVAKVPEGASFACRLEADLASARVISASPARRAEAVAALAALVQRARNSGFVQYELETRLAAAKLGGDDLAAVGRAAAAKGFKQIARLSRESPKKR